MINNTSIKIMDTLYQDLHVEDGILYASYAHKKYIDLTMAKELVRIRLAFQEEKIYPMLSELKFRYAGVPVRTHMSTEGVKGLSAAAFIIGQSDAELYYRYYMGFEKPIIPVRFFTDKNEAKKWLQQYIVH